MSDSTGPETYPNYNNPPETQWTLWREDIYGNQFRMPIQISNQAEAEQAQDEYTARGHHQTYSIKLLDLTDHTDFIPCE